MKTKLKICLAMGGGVALGSFSGSALTEALKLLLIYGKDKNGDPYDDVVVDGMSGASAGAIALTIMLRCLIDYKSMLLKWKPLQKDEDSSDNDVLKKREDLLKTSLAETYFDGSISNLLKFDQDNETKKIPSLVALELAQKIQEILWVKKVNAIKLFGETNKSNHKGKINESFGLLERAYMEKLIAEYLLDEKPNIDEIKVLDRNRVIFACSLTNILPMPINIPEGQMTKLQQNVIKSTGVFNHAEIRVIDYIFDEKILLSKPSDKRWLKFMSNPEQKGRTFFDLAKDESWSIISASALACGAFPIAFSPVLLKRYQEEYDISFTNRSQGKEIQESSLIRSTKVINGKELVTEWPEVFIDLQEEIAKIPKTNRNSVFNDEQRTSIDYKSFNFPYIDGGTFNNEPIKEAYRIASYQDFDSDDSNTERLVLFVDPIVRKEQNPSFKVRSFGPISGNDSPKKANEFSKFISSTTSLLSLLKDQGRIKESSKIKGIKENLELKEVLFEYLDKNKNIQLNSEICIKAFKKVFENLNDNIISIGTRHPIIYFIKQLELNAGNNWQGKPFPALYDNANAIMDDLLTEKPDLSLEEIYQAFDIIDKNESINIFSRTVFKVISDVSLDTAGKNRFATNAAILPINLQNDIIDLPGTEIAAFAGFASLSSKEYAFQYGRFSTLRSLSNWDGFRPSEYGGAFISDISSSKIESVQEKLIQEVRGSEFFSSNNDYSVSLKTGLFKPSIKRLQVVLASKFPILKKIWKLPLAPGLLIGGPIFSVIGGLISGGSNILNGKLGLSLDGLLRGAFEESAESVDYLENIPLTLSIYGKDFKKPFYKRLSNKKKLKLTFKTAKGEKYVRKAIRVPSNSEDSENRILFRLYLLKVSGKAIRKAGGFTSSRHPSLSIVAERRNRLPSQDGLSQALDPNIDLDSWSEAYHSQLPEPIETIKIDGFKHMVKLSNNQINDASQSLYHSLKNIEFHVNPMLELDIRKKPHQWYFKENTISFDEKILRSITLKK